MKFTWYHACFDSNWVQCNDFGCQKYFTRESIKGKRGCPNCSEKKKAYKKKLLKELQNN